MHMCWLVYMHIRYWQLGKTSDSTIIMVFNKFSEEFKVLSNANISATVSITCYGGHGETLSRESLVWRAPQIHSLKGVDSYSWAKDCIISWIFPAYLCYVRFVSGPHRSDQIHFSLDFKGHGLRCMLLFM